MKNSSRIWRGVASGSVLGALVAIAMLFVGLSGTRATARTAHAKNHAARASKTTAAHQASLRRASYKATAHRRRRHWRHRVILPKRPSQQRTEQIQEALERGGYYSGNPNGKWDASTQESLRRFQEANGLPPTGKLDALSLQKMGLGSDVAGVSAPRPITPAEPSTPSAANVPKTPGQ